MTPSRTFLAVLALAGSAQWAAAADLGGAPYRRPQEEVYSPARPFSWTGFYVGANVGYGGTTSDWGFDGSSLSHTGGGGLLGAQIGYNIQAGRAVFGIEGDLTSSWIDGTSACPNASFSCDHSINWMGSLRGRLGLTINDNRTLLYGTGGIAWADTTWTTTNALSGATFGTYSATQQGWVAGAGIEHMLTQNLSAKVEYLYYNFDTATAPAGTLDGGATKLDLSSQVVRFGLNLKF